jgi:hypothetical protein
VRATSTRATERILQDCIGLGITPRTTEDPPLQGKVVHWFMTERARALARVGPVPREVR